MPAMDVDGEGGPGGFVPQATRESPQETITTMGSTFRHLTTGDLVYDVSLFQPTSGRGSLLERSIRSINGNAAAGSESPVVAAPVVLVAAAPVVLVVEAPLPPEEVSLQLECSPRRHLKRTPLKIPDP
jgi:hypothetical protein